MTCTRDWDDYDQRDALTVDKAFNRHSMNDGHHVSPLDNNRVTVGTDSINVVMTQGIDEEAFKRTLSMAQRATIGVDLESEEAFSSSDWEEMLQGGLQTALETQVLVFAVSGVSRTCTHQLVRSRRASFHQQSQRASFMGNNPETRMPESVWCSPRAREAFLMALSYTHLAYRTACEEDISYQDARFILPEGTNNFILLEYSVREFLNVYAYRACSMFQWEIVAVTRMMGDILKDKYPWLAPHIKISCEKTVGSIDNAGMSPEGNSHACTFQGWESVEGQCSFPWARQSNRTYLPQAHKI